MNISELNEKIKEEKVDFVEDESETPREKDEPQDTGRGDNPEGFEVVLRMLQKPKKHTSTVPTGAPRNFAEQIVIYESGGTYRLYVWVNSTWRYVALT